MKIIHVHYTSDEETALINNALLDLSNIANNDEYNEYQSRRTKCKEVVKIILMEMKKLNKEEIIFCSIVGVIIAIIISATVWSLYDFYK